MCDTTAVPLFTVLTVEHRITEVWALVTFPPRDTFLTGVFEFFLLRLHSVSYAGDSRGGSPALSQYGGVVFEVLAT